MNFVKISSKPNLLLTFNHNLTKVYRAFLHRHCENLINPVKVRLNIPCRTAFGRCVHCNGFSKSFTTSSMVLCNKPVMPRKKRTYFAFGWGKLLVSFVFLGFFLAYAVYLRKEKEFRMAKERKRHMGKVKIGGKFTDLVDHDGNKRSSDDFLGKWCLIYFGFTHCPDICPEEMEKMGQVVDKINASKHVGDIQPLFISVDPKRDDVAAVKAYVKEFHPNLIGLTGSVEAIAGACKGFRVYFSEGPKDVDEDYIVDHTIIMYMINPDGEFVDYYGQNKDADEIHQSIIFNMLEYERLKKTGIRGVLNI